MKKYILALDQGTTSSRAILFDKNHRVVSMAQTELTQIYPQPAWVEQDPMEIWATQMGAMNQVIARSGISIEEIDSIGITNQRETTLIWNRKTGQPIYNAIVWQCRRTAEDAHHLIEQGHAEMIRKKTGLIVDAYFSATKIKWILDHVEGAYEQAKNGELMFGTVDSWLVYNLTNHEVHVTDVTNASRTMLFNIHTLEWDQDLLNLLNIPREILPEVKSSSEIYGYTTIQDSSIPIAGIAGDQQAALFGQKSFKPGQVKNTYGTGCFLLMNTGTQAVDSNNGLLSTIAIGIDGSIEYALEGSIFIGGAIVQWLRDEMGLISNARESEQYALAVEDTQGVIIVPAFTGLGAPYWDMDARGTITGLSRSSNRNHIIRAALESIAYQTHDVLKAMERDSHIPLMNLKVDGGASSNNFLMQFQADILDIEVTRPFVSETTALGACFLAGLATGFFDDRDAISNTASETTIYKPTMSLQERHVLLQSWTSAINRTLTPAE
ncbi:MAG: glycerol kinase GlpK [Erysipelothrix sp.]